MSNAATLLSANEYNGTTRTRAGVADMPEKVADRFWSKVHRGDGCWTWTAARSRAGYGQMLITTHGQRVLWYTHRLAYYLYVGDLVEGMMICHRCDVPACVRPDHLFIGTATDNARDASKKGRCRGTFRPGHRSSLSFEQVGRILGHLADRRSISQTAKLESVPYIVVYRIIKGIAHRKAVAAWCCQ